MESNWIELNEIESNWNESNQIKRHLYNAVLFTATACVHKVGDYVKHDAILSRFNCK